MTKNEYLSALRQKLSRLSKEDIEEYADYYAEMIDDRIEEGMTEEEAVAAVGSADAAAEKILSELPARRIGKEKASFGKLKAWHIILIILGAPVWLPLIVAAISVVVSVVVSVVSGVISLYAASFGLGIGAVAGICMIASYIAAANYIGAVFVLGSSFFCAGCAILLFALLFKLTKHLISLFKKIPGLISSAFVRKGEKA